MTSALSERQFFSARWLLFLFVLHAAQDNGFAQAEKGGGARGCIIDSKADIKSCPWPSIFSFQSFRKTLLPNLEGAQLCASDTSGARSRVCSNKLKDDGIFHLPGLIPGTTYKLEITMGRYKPQSDTLVSIKQSNSLNILDPQYIRVVSASIKKAPDRDILASRWTSLHLTSNNSAPEEDESSPQSVPPQNPSGASYTPQGHPELAEATRRGVFGASLIEKLPLPGIRTFDQFALLSPGVLPAPATRNHPGPGISASVGTSGQFTINGLRSRDNSFSIDGSDNNEEDVGVRRQGFVALVPQPIESILEFQVISSIGDTRFGRNLAGNVNVLSKYGGSEVHGTLYGFFNNRSLNARDFFDFTGNAGPAQLPLQSGGRVVRVDGSPRLLENPAVQTAPRTRLQTGAVFGGPLKLTRRKEENQTFFFASIERLAVSGREAHDFAVPTIAERGIFGTGGTGFSRLGSASTNKDFTPASLPGNAIFSLYPFPNRPSGPYGPNTYSTVLPADATAWIGSFKIDRKLSENQEISGRYNRTGEHSVLPVTGEGLYSSVAPKLQTQNVAFFFNTHSQRISSQSLRFSFGRTSSHFDNGQGSPRGSRLLPGTPFLLNAPLLLDITTPGKDPQYVSATRVGGLGYKGDDTEELTGPLGQLKMAGYSPLGVDVYNFPQRRANNTFQLADTITLVRGPHLLMGGFDIRHTRIDSVLDRNARPLAEFGGLRNPGGLLPLLSSGEVLSQDAYSPTTLAAAGVPTGFFQTLATSRQDRSLGVRFTQYSFFAQDSMQLLPNLRATIGLRYELNTVPATAGNKLENAFNKADLTAEARTLQLSCPGRCSGGGTTSIGLTNFFENIPDYRVGFGPDKLALHPRAGLVWTPATGKWSVRAGFGTYSSPAPGVVINQSRSAFPDFVPLNLVNFSPQDDSAPMLFNLANPAVRAKQPNLDVIQPGTLNSLKEGTSALGLLALNLYSLRGALSPTFPGLNLVLPSREIRNPRSYQYSLTVDTNLTSGIFVSAAYVGTRGVSLFRVSTPQGGLGRSLIQFDSDVQPVVGQTGTAVAFPSLSGVMRPPQDLRVANSFTIAPTIFESSATSTYHSLQLELKKHKGRFQFGSAFTFSHAIDDASDFFDTAGSFALPQNSRTPSERGSSGFDMRVRSVSHFVSEVRGFQLSGILTMQTGQPYTINSTFDINRDGNLTDRLVSTARLSTASSDRRIRVALAPGVNPLSMLALDGRDGAVGRNTFRAAGLGSLDLALTKSLSVSEAGHRVLLRAELFNALNRVNFGSPVRFLEGPGFGGSVDTTVPARTLQLVLKYSF
ncbi:MAG: TonB-dependent receptor [Acidobacteria bacterium]|nr:TonB-dependent receptor [Acidobacteriota bacterium]